MPEYIIHACQQREWYVNEYLVPSIIEQGIPPDNIEVWMDDKGMGNLFSCMKCFEYCGTKTGGRWHLQDDVVISSDFVKKTTEHDDGLVSGFVRREWQSLTMKEGRVPAVYMWNSFQCIRIPDEIAGECAEWFFTDACWRDSYAGEVRDNKCDDSLFYDFICERHLDKFVYNLAPSIVDHVDFLLGGSIVNKWRGHFARGDLWEDDAAFDNLKAKLARR